MEFNSSGFRASYRGVRFLVSKHTEVIGRNIQVASYVGSENLTSMDLGKKEKRYNIEAYVIGVDYIKERDELRKALMQKGVGMLIHPYLGETRVRVESVSLIESAKEGRMCRFSITFVEAGKNKDITLSGFKQIDKQANEARQASALQFASTIKLYNQSKQVVDSAQSHMHAATDFMERVANKATVESRRVSNIASSIADFRGAIHKLQRTPYEVASSFLSLHAAITSLFTTGQDNSITSLETPFSSFLDAESFHFETDQNKPTENENGKVITLLLQQAAVISCGEIMSKMKVMSKNSAESIEKQFNNFAQKVNTSSEVSNFISLTDFRLSSIEALRADSSGLHIEKKSLVTNYIPSLVFSKLKQTKEADILYLNTPQNPLFLKGEIIHV